MSPEELERVTTGMMALMEIMGIPIDSKVVLRTYIYHAFNDNRIKFIEKNRNPSGFMIWEEKEHDGCKCIHVTHLIVLPQFRPFSLKSLATYLKERYKISNRNIYWYNHPKNKTVTFVKKELAHV